MPYLKAFITPAESCIFKWNGYILMMLTISIIQGGLAMKNQTRGSIMKAIKRFLYLIVFVFFAMTTKPLRLAGIYRQERFLKVAKEVGVKLSSDEAVWLTDKINNKVKELKVFINSQETFDSTHKVAVSLRDEVNDLVEALVAENTKSIIYRCFVRFT